MRRSPSLFVLLVLSGIAAQSTAAGREIDFEVLLSASHSFAAPGDYVLRDDESWCEFWNAHHIGPTLVLPPLCPVIDFQHEIVIASVSGARPSSCYGLEIGPIERIRGRRAVGVVVSETAPAPDGGCICLRGLTQPTQIVVVPRPIGAIEFLHTVTEFSCNGG